MKVIFLVLSLSLCLGNTVFASEQNLAESNRELFLELQKVESLVTDPNQTCLDEYVKERKRMMKRSLIAPIYGAVGVPLGAGFGGSLGLLTGLMLGVDGSVLAGGSGALAAMVSGGMVVGTTVAVGAFVAYETVNVTRLIQMNRMIKLVSESYLGEGEQLSKFYARLKAKNENFPLSLPEVAAKVVALDQENKLCNGTFTRKERPISRHLLMDVILP
jgi:hypothetical protein